MEDGGGGDDYALDEIENVKEQDGMNWVRERWKEGVSGGSILRCSGHHPRHSLDNLLHPTGFVQDNSTTRPMPGRGGRRNRVDEDSRPFSSARVKTLVNPSR